MSGARGSSVVGRHRLFVGALVLLGAVYLQSGPVLAADLVPPPPPDARCSAGPAGTVCFFSRTLSFDNDPLFGFDGAPMMCGSSQLVESGDIFLDVKRTYNVDGLLTRIQRHFNGPRNTFTIGNPGTGSTLPNPGHWTETYDLTEPGSFPPVAVLTVTGNFFSITAPGNGAVFFDVGRIQFSQDGDVQFEAGPKVFFDTQSLASLCAALA